MQNYLQQLEICQHLNFRVTWLFE